MQRRIFLFAAGGLVLGAGLKPASSQAEDAMQDAIAKVVGAAKVREGKVTLTVPSLVENGNTVSLSVTVESPMTEADHVKAIHIFNEKNPQPNVASFRLGPRAGRASVATRVRLADTQTLVAICQMSDGTFWSDSADVVVTLAACLEIL
jgi:sulfur-oxidizing protein SoxY